MKRNQNHLSEWLSWAEELADIDTYRDVIKAIWSSDVPGFDRKTRPHLLSFISHYTGKFIFFHTKKMRRAASSLNVIRTEMWSSLNGAINTRKRMGLTPEFLWRAGFAAWSASIMPIQSIKKQRSATGRRQTHSLPRIYSAIQGWSHRGTYRCQPVLPPSWAIRWDGFDFVS